MNSQLALRKGLSLFVEWYKEYYDYAPGTFVVQAHAKEPFALKAVQLVVSVIFNKLIYRYIHRLDLMTEANPRNEHEARKYNVLE